MRMPKNVFRAILVALAAVPVAGVGTNADGDTLSPTVVELFTSQSCYSCPPAEAYLGDLAGREGILALEFHVDYWDDLVYGSHGRWKDVFSKPAFTERQRTYNAALRGTRSVYTPQMVVDGQAEEVGSRREAVGRLLDDASVATTDAVSLAVDNNGEGGLSVRIDGGAGAVADVWLATFLKENTTKVLRGENHGKELTNHNVVREFRRIGEWRGGAQAFAVPGLAPGEGQGCAVLVQAPDGGPVLGASYCPGDAGRGS